MLIGNNWLSEMLSPHIHCLIYLCLTLSSFSSDPRLGCILVAKLVLLRTAKPVMSHSTQYIHCALQLAPHLPIVLVLYTYLSFPSSLDQSRRRPHIFPHSSRPGQGEGKLRTARKRVAPPPSDVTNHQLPIPINTDAQATCMYTR